LNGGDLNFYPFHIGDYASHTRHLTLMGDLAYRRLLDLLYLTERPLPLDAEECARLIGMRDHVRDVSEVLSDFFLKSEAGWTNQRAQSEIEAYRHKADRARAANRSRWNAGKNLKSDLKSDADQIPTNNHEPITKNQRKPNTTRASALSCPPDVDEQVWADFLRHRKTKRAELTATALSGLRREASRAGITLQAALETCCQRGWTGFKADWMRQDLSAPASVSTRRSRIDSYAAQAAAARGEHGHDRHDGTVIDAEVTRLA